MNKIRVSFHLVVLAAFVLATVPGQAQEDQPSGTSASAASSTDSKSPARPDKDTKDKDKKYSEILDIVDRLEYPELQVVPRASQRLKIEAQEEDHNWYYTHWTLELSGLTTFLVGNSGSQKREGLSDTQIKDANQVANIAKVVGLGWFTAGILLGFQRPYRSGTRLINSTVSGEKGERAALLRERLAEETLERPAKVLRSVNTFAIVTNFVCSAGMGVYLTDQGRLFAGMSAILAFLPNIFENHAIEVYDKHIEYKKKIYGPLAGVALAFDESTMKPVTMTQFTWNF